MAQAKTLLTPREAAAEIVRQGDARHRRSADYLHHHRHAARERLLCKGRTAAALINSMDVMIVRVWHGLFYSVASYKDALPICPMARTPESPVRGLLRGTPFSKAKTEATAWKPNLPLDTYDILVESANRTRPYSGVVFPASFTSSFIFQTKSHLSRPNSFRSRPDET